MTEQMLIETAKQGRPEALEQLYLQNHSRVFHLALRYVKFREDAEDIAQETFLKAFNGIQSYDLNLGGQFSSWINRICIHCALDHLRTRKRRRGESTSLESLPVEPPSTDPSPEQIALQRRVSGQVYNAAGVLPPRQQKIFFLRYREHLNIRQIALRLECSQGNIRAQLFRSTAKMRHVFQSDF